MENKYIRVDKLSNGYTVYLFTQTPQPDEEDDIVEGVVVKELSELPEVAKKLFETPDEEEEPRT